MASDNSSSANTAILAIFAMLVLMAIGYFVLRNTGGGGGKIEISTPKISSDKAPSSLSYIR